MGFMARPVETSRQSLHNGRMTSDAACVEANIDYGNGSGYLVRLTSRFLLLLSTDGEKTGDRWAVCS
jgi:hypothetical protein